MHEKGEFEAQNIRIITINIMVENQMMLFRMHNPMTSTSHESSFRVSSVVKMLSAVDFVRAYVWVCVCVCLMGGDMPHAVDASRHTAHDLPKN